MKVVAKNSDYAIRALLVLADNSGSFVSARDIAKAQAIPYQFLRRILQELIKNKLVISREGGRGGFSLKKDPKTISAVDVIKIFQGNLQLIECTFRKGLCRNRSTCILRKEIARIEKVINKEFEGITIASLSRNTKRTTKKEA